MAPPSLGGVLRGLQVGVASVRRAAPLLLLVNDSRLHPKWRAVAVATGLALLLLLYLLRGGGAGGGRGRSYGGHGVEWPLRDSPDPPYNSTYPLTPPQVIPRGLRYRVAAIADLDQDSKSNKHQTWVSLMKTGSLTLLEGGGLELDWDQETLTLEGHLAERGRGMELSELVVFNGRLYSVDDRTGVVYRIDIEGRRAVPWVILQDGDGSVSKGFKAEWLAVKDHQLVVGGVGTEGEEPNNHPQWVKVVGLNGDVSHQNWRLRYDAMRRAAGIEPPDSLLHRSAVWSERLGRWFFLPLRLHGNGERSNLLVSCQEDFGSVRVGGAPGPQQPPHSFSSFRLVPGTGDQVVVALRSHRDSGGVATFAVGFSLDGRVLMPPTKMADNVKYEGLEFI